MPTTAPLVLDEAEWRARAAAHRARVAALDRAAPGTPPPRRAAPGAGLPVHLLLAAAAAAGALAARAGARAARRRTSCSRSPGHVRDGDLVAARPRGAAAAAGRAPPGSCATCSPRPRPARPGWAASGCTSGPWSTAPTPRGTAACRCGWAPPAPTRCWSRCRCTAPTTTPSASSPTAARPRNALVPTRADQARPGAAGLPARHHGPVQVGLQAGPGHAVGAGRRLLRARGRGARAGHAGQPLRPGRVSAIPRCASRPRPGGPSTPAPRPGSPPAPPRCASGCWPSAHTLLRRTPVGTITPQDRAGR